MGFQGSWCVGGVDVLRGVLAHANRAWLARPPKCLFRAPWICASDLHVAWSELYHTRSALIRRSVMNALRSEMQKGEPGWFAFLISSYLKDLNFSFGQTS